DWAGCRRACRRPWPRSAAAAGRWRRARHAVTPARTGSPAVDDRRPRRSGCADEPASVGAPPPGCGGSYLATCVDRAPARLLEAIALVGDTFEGQTRVVEPRQARFRGEVNVERRG